MTEAHAIDIERCTECPFISEHTRDDRTAQCTHPAITIAYGLDVNPRNKPPKTCPVRHKLTVLRVTS